jgi:hypothetical protein
MRHQRHVSDDGWQTCILRDKTKVKSTFELFLASRK